MANKYQLMVLLGGVIAVSALITFSGSLSSTVFGVASAPAVAESAIMGHIEITVYDPDGNMLAYRQTDNVVTNVGIECITSGLFGVSTGCTLGTAFDQVAIGDATAGTCTEDAVSPSLGSEVQRVTATSVTGGTASAPPASPRAVVEVDTAFTMVGTGSIDNSAVYDSTVSPGPQQLSNQCFTPVAYIDGSTININWDYNVG